MTHTICELIMYIFYIALAYYLISKLGNNLLETVQKNHREIIAKHDKILEEIIAKNNGSLKGFY